VDCGVEVLDQDAWAVACGKSENVMLPPLKVVFPVLFSVFLDRSFAI